jgi:hypothetical protein
MSSNLALSIPYQDLKGMAADVAESKLFGLRTPAQVLAMMLIAQANGQHPAVAMRDYDIIDSQGGPKPAKKSDAMLRDYFASGGSVAWECLTDERVTATFTHSKGSSALVDWDIARAQRAELAGKGNWKKYARSMLRARVISEGVKLTYPAATGGLLTSEEAADVVDTDVQDVSGQSDSLMPQRKQPPQASAPVADDVTDVAFTDKPASAAPAPSAPPSAATTTLPATVTSDAGPTISVNEAAYLRNKARAADVDPAAIAKRFGVDALERLTKAQFETVKHELVAL